MNALTHLKALTHPYRRTLRKLREGKLRLHDVAYSSTLIFSQFGEDIFLASYFAGQTRGFYVDIGAFHPTLLSTTHLLYRNGWNGINVEPNPEGYGHFLHQRTRDINLQCAISSKPGRVEFTCDGVFSGIDDDTHLFRSKNPAARKIFVEARPLADVLARYVPNGRTIDFMSVDCEGHDLEVIRSNDWARYRPRVVLVEDHQQRPGTELDRQMEIHGYIHYCRLRLTKIFVEAGEAARELPAARRQDA